MFIGHFGVGLAAKAAAPRISLGTLFLSVQFVDLLWPTLLLLGLERVEVVPGITRVTPLDFVDYPITHSLVAVVGWGLLFAVVYRLTRKHVAGAVVCGLGVFSHWVLDLLTHRPDLPLIPGGDILVGLGLWNSLWGTVAVEVPLFALGVWLYLRTTWAVDRMGSWGFWGLVVMLLTVYVANLFGPAPPSAAAVAWMSQAQWMMIVMGYMIDNHRRVA